MTLIRIETNAVDIVWPHVKDLLQLSVDRNLGEFTIEDVEKWLRGGQMDLWVIGNKEDGIILAGTTEFVDYPRERRLRVVLGSSKKNTMDSWLKYCWHEDSELIRFARDNNVKRFEILARDGWIRVLSKEGFKKYCTVLTREVN